MNWKLWLYVAAGLLVLVILGGVGYKITAPTTKTVVGNGGKVVYINNETPKVPLGGCALWRLNTKIYWEKNK